MPGTSYARLGHRGKLVAPMPLCDLKVADMPRFAASTRVILARPTESGDFMTRLYSGDIPLSVGFHDDSLEGLDEDDQSLSN